MIQIILNASRVPTSPCGSRDRRKIVSSEQRARRPGMKEQGTTSKTTATTMRTNHTNLQLLPDRLCKGVVTFILCCAPRVQPGILFPVAMHILDSVEIRHTHTTADPPPTRANRIRVPSAFVPIASQLHLHLGEASPKIRQVRERRQQGQNVVAPSWRRRAPSTTTPSKRATLPLLRPLVSHLHLRLGAHLRS